ncbi:MAG: exonuclease sbcCD subunit D, partial [Halomonas sp.]|nr:exonuclease sbcCD subunit D [Halomonas sp.]
HLHGPQYRGSEHIRYSGSLLKYSFSEASQRKGVTLVDLDATGVTRIEQIPLLPRREVRVLEGELDALIARGRTDPQADDYLLVRLTDRHAILDPMGKLRAVYPNVLHLEKPGMLEARGSQQLDRERLTFSTLDMFSDFFAQTSGEPMTDQQTEAISTLIGELSRDEEAQG